MCKGRRSHRICPSGQEILYGLQIGGNIGSNRHNDSKRWTGESALDLVLLLHVYGMPVHYGKLSFISQTIQAGVSPSID